ncbi:hypothetical protein PHMEG_00041299, partial [Phytophthora megakarya]
GKGKRVVQHLRGTDCLASLSVTLSRNRTSFGAYEYRYRVNHTSTVHTHPVSERIWRAYADNRRVQDPNIIGMVHTLVKAKSPFKQIYIYVVESLGTYLTSGDEKYGLNKQLQTELLMAVQDMIYAISKNEYDEA